MPEILYSSHYNCDPFLNMAFDEWMFGRVLATKASVFLRLYTWACPSITFGFNQDLKRAFDHNSLGSTPAIRRVTGGRALLHDPSELTYSIAVNRDGTEAQEIGEGSDLSRLVAETLVDFLERIGVTSEYVHRSSMRNSHPEFFHKAPCFASQAKYEVMSRGEKMIASAQRRINRAVFQHGSIKIGGVASHPAVSLGPEGTKVTSALSRLTAERYRQLEREFMRAFELRWGLPVVALELSPCDQERLQERLLLVKKKCYEQRDIFKQN